MKKVWQGKMGQDDMVFSCFIYNRIISLIYTLLYFMLTTFIHTKSVKVDDQYMSRFYIAVNSKLQ